MEELNISKLAIGDIYCTNYDGLTVLQILDTTVVTIPKEVIYAKYDTYGDDKYQKQIPALNMITGEVVLINQWDLRDSYKLTEAEAESACTSVAIKRIKKEVFASMITNKPKLFIEC